MEQIQKHSVFSFQRDDVNMNTLGARFSLEFTYELQSKAKKRAVHYSPHS